MIPRNSLPFGIRRILSILASPRRAISTADLEAEYAETLGVRTAVLLPSARAGIRMTIQAAGGTDMIAVGPAYTCETVHAAMVMSGARVELIDAEPKSFLMAPGDVSASAGAGCALVLSEVYGIPYGSDMLQTERAKSARIRVLDMAMSIPHRERMRQMESRDVALFSFGWGKPMYAGWGGIACFQHPGLAERVRELRDRSAMPEGLGLGFRHCCSALFTTSMNQRDLYALTHQRRLYRLYGNRASCREGHGGTALRRLSPKWTVPMTGLNRRLALHNLRDAVQNADLRRQQAELYFASLVETGIVGSPGGSAMPQSHFPIRLPSTVRDSLCDYLRGSGIDTSTIFPLPAGIGRDRYPWAAQASDEVVALPLGPGLDLEAVRMISDRIKEGLRKMVPNTPAAG